VSERSRAEFGNANAYIRSAESDAEAVRFIFDMKQRIARQFEEYEDQTASEERMEGFRASM